VTTQRLRAPVDNGAVVAEPPLDRVGDLLSVNQHGLNTASTPILGRSFDEVRRHARQSLVAVARRHMEQSGEPLPAREDGPLFMAGHQPELFHPGVWLKNFALHGLARWYHGLAVNLIVDNDTAKTAALQVPTPATTAVPWPHALAVPYDHWSGEAPYEERTVADEELFASFADRASAALAGWNYQPLLQRFWVEVGKQTRRTPLLGERLTAARRALERSWGCHNLEVPVSRVCQTEPFAWFACHLLGELPRFHALYNACLRDYRRRNGLRSRHHPVPDLAEQDGWLEAPFWAWRVGQTRRGRLLVRHEGETIRLRVGPDDWPSLPLSTSGEGTVEAWLDLEQQGFKVRSRALTNTMYARLFLADLFLHGIGGGKYDELNDAIAQRFFGWQPPAFLVLSGTLWLPLPAYPVQANDVQRLGREMRDLHWNPQRHLEAATSNERHLQKWLAQKQAWIARQPANAAQRRERFTTLRELNRLLQPALFDHAEHVRRQWEQAERQLQANAVLRRRDYAFCLYAENELRSFCTRFL
jgi:hypothetical protein